MRTYCYVSECGLSADELWWLIVTETLMEELGLDDIGAAIAIASGANMVPTRAKPGGAIPRTSEPQYWHGDYCSNAACDTEFPLSQASSRPALG